jgi:hypothetical protein
MASLEPILSRARARCFRSNARSLRSGRQTTSAVASVRFHRLRVEQATAAFDLTPNRIDECRCCEQAAGRPVSVRLGFGANTSGPRSKLVATIRATDTALTEAGVARGSEEEKRHNKRRAIHSRW